MSDLPIQPKKQIFSTTNFQIANWLLANDIAIEQVKWTKDRAEFIFVDFANREQLVKDFFREEFLQKWISSGQELKARMYADRPPINYER